MHRRFFQINVGVASAGIPAHKKPQTHLTADEAGI
jgi:hypothetical protein